MSVKVSVSPRVAAKIHPKNHDNHDEAPHEPSNKNSTFIVLSVALVVLFILFAIFTEYETAYSEGAVDFDPDFELKYGWFQDVHIMIFIGFGFLMVYLKHHGFGSVGFNYLVGCAALLWSVLTNNFFHQVVGFLSNGVYSLNPLYGEPTVHTSDPLVYRFSFNGTMIDVGKNTTYDNSTMDSIYVDPSNTHSLKYVSLGLENIITADFTAAACLISFGAVLGKVNASQLLIMVFFECIFFAFNEAIGASVLQVSDVGGSIFVHLFGAIFGVFMSRILTTPRQMEEARTMQVSSTTSDLFAMVGAVFLFCFWPSFNGALASGEGRHRVVVNTVIALCGSTLATFLFSGLASGKRQFLMEHIQNAALAGGVAVGSSADLLIRPWGALLLGLFAGAISTLGFAFGKDFLEKRFKLHDSCGVLHLHGVPAILGALGGVFSTLLAPTSVHSCSQYASTAQSWSSILADMESTQTTASLHDLYSTGCAPGTNRTLAGQAGFQFAATILTIAIAAASGTLTGAIMKQPRFGPVFAAFSDQPFWEPNGDE